MVFGLFSKEKALERAIKKATNKHAQSADRFAALEKLGNDGSDEALLGLCRRFSFNYDKTIDDEQEKQWVYETLVSKGEAALPALRTYMKTATSIAFPLRVLERVASGPDGLEIIDELLAVEEPGYTRDPTKRIQLIEWLGDWTEIDDAEVVKRVTPYLGDFDENVKFSTVEALSGRTTDDCAEALVTALTNPEEESKRLKVRIAEVMAEGKLDLCGKKAEVVAMLDNELTGFKLHRDKLQRSA